MKFIRFITQGPLHAFFNMALDEAISEAARKKISPPTLRLYQWDRPSMSIGYFQKVSDINSDYCRKKDYPVVRRLTGGRAILHNSELTYSFSSSTDSHIFRGTLLENYSVISNALVTGLKSAGIDAISSFERKKSNSHRNPACFKAVSYGEITVDGKKLIGSAQRRYSDGFMQHGSILLSLDTEELCRSLMHGSKDDFSGIGSVREYAPDISVNNLTAALKEAFEESLKVKLITDNPTQFELDLAKKLEKEKYSSVEWNFKR
jgi:lipoate-protein ligase A